MVVFVFGGAGSGKSLLLDILKKKYKAFVIEADKTAHELYEPEREGYNAVIKLLGRNILNKDGTLNRKAMGEVLYKNTELINKINELIHPMVWESISNKIRAIKQRNENSLIIVEAALIPEDKRELKNMFDSYWFVYADKKIRRKRLKESRNYSDERISDIMEKQPLTKDYIKFCDVLIENNSDCEELEKKLEGLLFRLD